MIEEKKIREAFEKWYFSRRFVPCGVMFTNHCYLGFKYGVEYTKQLVKRACAFYQKYKGKPEYLWQERPEYREKLRELFVFHKENGEPYFCENDHGWEKYDEWLFKESFKTILGEVSASVQS